MVRKALNKLLGEGNFITSFSYQCNACTNKRCSESVKGWQVSMKASEEQHKKIPACLPLQANTNISLQIHVTWRVKIEIVDAHVPTELWPYWHYIDMGGWLLKLEHWNGKILTLYVNNHLECMELCLGTDEELTKIRIKGKTGTGEGTGH